MDFREGKNVADFTNDFQSSIQFRPQSINAGIHPSNPNLESSNKSPPKTILLQENVRGPDSETLIRHGIAVHEGGESNQNVGVTDHSEFGKVAMQGRRLRFQPQ